MSSHPPSEITLLLDSQRPANRHFRWSPETLLIPIALVTRLASQVQQTTFVEFVRLGVCRLWKTWHPDDPAASLPPNVCDIPAIERSFSTVVAVLGTTEGILSIVLCGVLSHVSSRYGRKPALLVLLVSGFVGACLIPTSQYISLDPLADWIFLWGFLFQLSSTPLLYSFLINIYIVDVCAPENKTTALSKIGGWAMLGNCISFGLGGFITTKTGDPLIVFYASAALCAISIVYVVSVLPESFPKERRNAVSHMRPESSTPDSFLSTILIVFKPLKMLVQPPRADGTRNWRLAWCAIHLFIFMSVNAYVTTAWMVHAMSKYNLTPADTGLFLAIVTISGTIFLTGIVPPLVRFLRPYYNDKIARVGDADAVDDPLVETSDRLDVHLAFASCVVAGVAFVGAAASTTNSALILSGIFIGMTYVHSPTLRSLTASTVEPRKQGEALAAVEIVSNVGACLSPIIVGSLMTATISTAPLLPFYVHLVVVLASSALLFLVRDADRYRSLDIGDSAAVH